MSATPLHARLFRKQLTSAELLLLMAMVEHSRDGKGEMIWASTGRLAAYAKLSLRQAKRLIDSLLTRRILRELAPANSKGRRMPATYAINEAALADDPKMQQYIRQEAQIFLPATGDTMPRPVTPCPLTGDTMSPNPLTNPLKNPKEAPLNPLIEILQLGSEDKAADFQKLVQRKLERLGFEVKREYPIWDGDRYHQVDLKAKRGKEILSIECDRRSPRDKSLEWLALDSDATRRLIVLREPLEDFSHVPCFDDLIATLAEAAA